MIQGAKRFTTTIDGQGKGFILFVSAVFQANVGIVVNKFNRKQNASNSSANSSLEHPRIITLD